MWSEFCNKHTKSKQTNKKNEGKKKEEELGLHEPLYKDWLGIEPGVPEMQALSVPCKAHDSKIQVTICNKRYIGDQHTFVVSCIKL